MASDQSNTPHVITLAAVDSTNAEAMRRLNAGERGPLWIRADQQTAGRGRSGRTWTSEPGNLYASFLTSFPGGSAKAFQISLVAGVAIHDAIRDQLGTATPALLQVKWPNDILIGRDKTGGILVESTTTGGKALSVIIGIGLNLVSHPADTQRPAAHLGQFGSPPLPDDMLAAIHSRLTHWLAVWGMGQGFSAVREAWLERALPIGSKIAVNGSTGPLEGLFHGLDEDGALEISLQSGDIVTIHYGDVTLAA